VKAIDEALDYAISHDHPASVAAAATILAEIGNADALLFQGPRPAPLALALRNPDRRVRIAAAKAIVALKPQGPYPGSSYLPETLRFFAATSGSRKILLAGGNLEQMRKIIPALTSAGFQVETAATGREALRMASSSPDYEFALIDATIDRPPIDFLLQQLRHDYRSADLRVGVLARADLFARAERAAEKDPLAKAFARPHDEKAVHWQLAQLAALRPRQFVDFQERKQQAAEAVNL
ncbi:MAG: hypothetical protein ACWGMZ_11475, partial [Thermoguttaceae bacterium]